MKLEFKLYKIKYIYLLYMYIDIIYMKDIDICMIQQALYLSLDMFYIYIYEPVISNSYFTL